MNYKWGDTLEPVLEVLINKTAIDAILEAEVKKKVEEASYRLYFVDAKKIAELCCVSVKFLEEHVFSDPRARVLMIQKERKRLWKAEKIFDVIEEILSE